jgi:NTE family protein
MGRGAISIANWLFLRLPLAFSIPFSILVLYWTFAGFAALSNLATPTIADGVNQFARAHLPHWAGDALVRSLQEFIRALIVITIFLLGFVFAYNISALINWLIFRADLKPRPYSVGVPVLPDQFSNTDNLLSGIQKIGIVLAGGGAKGAYQAGAMKAIYSFLEKQGALSKVKVICGTSIGSWNALFWLADLIKPEDGWPGASTHEKWWARISAKSLTAPSWYVPFLRNCFLSSRPWQAVFDRIFGVDPVRRHLCERSDIHYYLTRSDVRTGQLQCVTNNDRPPYIARVTYQVADLSKGIDSYLECLKFGVFASMDLPPLFPFAQSGSNLFEDGGVIDNLPISFAAVEECDLIFILPLNSDFEEKPNTTSIAARLLRVMDVRQGALERNGFKLLYLYNELAALRQASLGATSVAPDLQPALDYALHRSHRVMNVFAICPLKSFVQENLNTHELWNSSGAKTAFDKMFVATRELLPTFQFEPQSKIRVALVSSGGNITWDEQF